MDNKYVCPKCNGKNIVIWEQTVIEKLYHIRKDGKSYKKNFSNKDIGAEALSGLMCIDCLNQVNFRNNNDIYKWDGEKNEKTQK